MGAIIPLLLPLIGPLIQGVEAIFSKPKSGPDKVAAVANALRQIIEQLMIAGIPVAGQPIPEKSVTDDLLKGAIEAELARLKASGQLAAQATGTLYMVRGVVVPLSTI